MNKGMMKSKNKIMLITLGCIGAVFLIIILIGAMNPGRESLPSVDTITVTKGDVTQEVDASGSVESEQKKTFFSPINGEVQTMSAGTGDTVEEGQAIIGFNLESLESENQKAELNVRSGQLEMQDAQQQAADAASRQAQAQARIPELEAQIEEKQNQISSLQQQISEAQSQAAEDAQAQAQIAASEAQKAYEAALAQAELEYRQAKEKYDTVTKPEYDRRLEELKALADREDAPASAQTDYEYALNHPPAEPVMQEINPEDYMASGSGSQNAAVPDTSDLQYQIESASSELAQLQSELASQDAAAQADTPGLTSAAQEQMRISNNLAELEAMNLQELMEKGRKGIQAEFKGVISDAQVTQGATVTQGMELFTLQSTEQVCVEANISKYDFDKVKEGQKASITLGDSEYQGTVEKISKIAIPNEQGTPLIGVTIHIDNPDDNIFIGVEAQASIQAAQAKDVPLLPVEAVNIGKDGSFCYVVEDGKITEKAIETGVTSDSYVEITKGLQAGDQVIRDIGSHEVGDSVVAVEAAR